MRSRFAVLFLAVVLLGAASANADPVRGPQDSTLPSHLVCIPEDSEAGQKIEITQFNSDDAEWNMDGNFMGRTKDNLMYRIGFSNECDNDYSLLFFTDDLLALAVQKSKTVTGLLRFWNADVPENRTVHMTCTVAQSPAGTRPE